METIPLTKAKARLSGLIERLNHRKEQVVITKHGKPLAALVPYEDWERCAAGAAGGPASGGLDVEAGPDTARLPARERRERGGDPLWDLQLAAMALRHRLTVVTGNVRRYAGIPGLKVENGLAP